MSGLEIAAAAVLGSQLLEAKYLISDDVLLAKTVALNALPYLWKASRGKASYWYFFEKSVFKNPNNKALAFPRPRKNAPPPRVDDEGFQIYDDQFDLEEYTYKELYDMVLKYSYILKHEYGVTANDTIGVSCMNKPLFIVLWLALWNIGALPAFLNFNTKDKPLIHCLKIVNASQVFVDPDCDAPIKDTESQIKEELPHVKIGRAHV